MLTQNDGGAGLEATLDVSVKLRDSTYSTIQSAISFLYWKSGLVRPEELKGGIILYCKFLRRNDRQLKQDLGLKILEEKISMSQEIFRFLAN